MKKVVFFLNLFAITGFMAAAQQADLDRATQEHQKKAGEWVAALQLNDPEKEARLTQVIATHLTQVRDWHNTHPYTTVPEGINLASGQKLNQVERQVIATSAMPKSVHDSLMNGLRRDLNNAQVDSVLDKYTIGKVAFTMKGYQAIVPNMTEKETATIEAFLKQAREQAVDFKNMKEISAIFEIYKTKCEQFLNANGRNWKEMYKAYTDKVKAEKAAKAAQKQ